MSALPIEALAWHDASTSKPDPNESALLWLRRTTDAHGPVTVWEPGFWDGEQWCDYETGDPIIGEVLAWAIPKGPGAPNVLEALKNAEAGLEFAGADQLKPTGAFVPTPLLALRAVRRAIKEIEA